LFALIFMRVTRFTLADKPLSKVAYPSKNLSGLPRLIPGWGITDNGVIDK